MKITKLEIAGLEKTYREAAQARKLTDSVLKRRPEWRRSMVAFPPGLLGSGNVSQEAVRPRDCDELSAGGDPFESVAYGCIGGPREGRLQKGLAVRRRSAVEGSPERTVTRLAAWRRASSGGPSL